MTYFQNLNRLVLKELELRADLFADGYDPAKRSIILIPGGMGSKLMQCKDAYAEGNFPDNPAFSEIWLSWPAILFGKVDEFEKIPDALNNVSICDLDHIKGFNYYVWEESRQVGFDSGLSKEQNDRCRQLIDSGKNQR